MEENQIDSIIAFACKLKFSISSTQRTVKNNFEIKPYKFHRVYEFSEQHEIQWLDFCNWFRLHEVDPQKVSFSNGK